MTKRTRSVLAMLAILYAVAQALPAQSFKTFALAGGTIHEDITTDALSPAPISVAHDGLEAIDSGNEHQDHVLSDDFAVSSHHFDDNQLRPSLAYIDERFRTIAQLTPAAASDKSARSKILFEFGQALHAAQDFYSHSNWVETQLKQDATLSPSNIPLPTLAQMGGVPVRTGYFYWKGKEKNETIYVSLSERHLGKPTRDFVISKLKSEGHVPADTQFVADQQYASLTAFDARVNYAADYNVAVLHRDLNKDNGDEEQGKAINPATGKSLYEYARGAATRETQRQWQRLEQTIRNAGGDDALIAKLKSGS